MHSTEQLKKQYDEAVERHRLALESKNKAERLYERAVIDDALAAYAAKGITPGSKVILIRNGWQYDRVAAGFLGFERGWGVGVVNPIFSRLKNDGTPSKSRKYYHFDSVEPFEAASSQRPDEEAK